MRRQSGGPSRASDATTVVVGVLRLIDVIIVVAAGMFAYWVRHGGLDLPDNYWAAITIGALLAMNIMHFAELYSFANVRHLGSQIGRLTGSWIAVIVTLIAIAYFTKTSEGFSRLWVLMWLSASYVGFLLTRLAVRLQLMQWTRDGRLSARVAIVGAGEVGSVLVRYIAEQADSGLRLLGVYDDDPARRGVDIDGNRVVGNVDDLVRYGREKRVDEVIIAMPWHDRDPLLAVMRKLKPLAVDVKLCPETISYHIPPRGFSMVAGVPMLNIYERPLSGWSIVLKAVEDRVLAALILILSFPLLCLIAILIRLGSPGPVMFRQTRYGFNNNEFTVFKFRSMRLGSGDDSTVPQAMRNDPRVTGIGAFLRRTSLDELPQLWNVLRGDMSLVGPRPHAVAHNVHYADIVDDYLSRHRVKPGITGWAQVNGLRGETEAPEKMRARVQYDLNYIDNWSLWLDLKILVMTAFVGFANKNAY